MPSCPDFRCSLDCEHFELKRNGCRKCKCKTTQYPTSTSCPKCNKLCSNGYSDCDECICNGCSRKRCRVGCPYGFLEDERGCKMCACKELISPKVSEDCGERVCPFLCRHGYKEDRRGCNTCSCNANPANYLCEAKECLGLRCGRRFLKLDENSCETCQCDKRHSNNKPNHLTNRMCASPMCAVTCRYGLATVDGCPTCSCNPAPGNIACSVISCTGFKCQRLLEDSNGCEVCMCADPPVILKDTAPTECETLNCRLPCFGDYERNSEGCLICKCRSGSAGDSICPSLHCGGVKCEDGPEYDTAGCATCRCAIYTGDTGGVIGGQHCDNLACKELSCGIEGFAYDSRGCRICECAPPKSSRICVEPMCDEQCVLGYAYDSQGCMTCTCNLKPTEEDVPSTCPLLTCSSDCQFGLELDNFGCEMCLCRSDPICPNIDMICNLRCQHGLDVDQHGCPVCVCKCPEVRCRMGCPNGFAVDPITKCKECTCVPMVSKCDVQITQLCPEVCSRGYAKDKMGCETCVCLSQFRRCTTPEVHCFAPCPSGYVRDEQGCRTCACLVDVEVEQPKCPEVMCLLFCQFGFKKSETGCNLCICKEKSESTIDIQRCQGGEPICSNYCKEYKYDENNCMTCHCESENPEDENPTQLTNENRKTKLCNRAEPMCAEYCKEYKYDDDNCMTCECLSVEGISVTEKSCNGAEPMCYNFCKEYKYDNDNCMTCNCKSGKPEDENPTQLTNENRKTKLCNKGEPICDDYCEEYKYDDDNCMTCECLSVEGISVTEKSCNGAEPMCYNFCKEYKYDNDNCMTCNCKSGKPEDENPTQLTNENRKTKLCNKGEPICDDYCEEYKYDDDNCMTCECLSVEGISVTEKSCNGPEPMCYNFCKEYKYDENNCMTCNCKSGNPEDENPTQLTNENRKTKLCNKGEPLCDSYCEEYKYDDDNCMTCECLSVEGISVTEKSCNGPEPMCYNFCKEYKYDENNCMTCNCKSGNPEDENPTQLTNENRKTKLCNKGEPICDGYCKEYKYDDDNCLTCECLSPIIVFEKKCAEPMCHNKCDAYKYDENNCMTCDCVIIVSKGEKKQRICAEPMCFNKCERYSKDSNGCFTCICEIEAKTENPVFVKERSCPEYRTVCDHECPGGYIRDENYCLTCECLHVMRVFPVITTTAKPTTIDDRDCLVLAECWIFCISGRERDENGCEMCQCKKINNAKKRHGYTFTI